MLSMYPACFFHEDNNYSVVFPDLNWLFPAWLNNAALKKDINFSQVLQDALKHNYT